jgi:hypothetical protein
MKDNGVVWAIAISVVVILGWGWPLSKEYWLIVVAWLRRSRGRKPPLIWRAAQTN